MRDDFLLYELIEYNKARRIAFNNYELFDKNPFYERILSARYQKNHRIKNRLYYMITHRKYLYFCTFTFDDSFLKKCTRTKRDLIKASLSCFDSDILYILNIDYGKKNEREHYHAIVGTDNSLDLRNHLKLYYPFFTSCDSINTSSDDIKRLTKYINKLANHTSKDTTANKRVVYNFKGFDKYSKDISSFFLNYCKQHFS